MNTPTVPCPHCRGTGQVPAPPPRCRATLGNTLDLYAHRCEQEPGHLGRHSVSDWNGFFSWDQGDGGTLPDKVRP